ncbi:DUF1206 domain-containing protein [Actinocorallia lasiicapitis]
MTAGSAKDGVQSAGRDAASSRWLELLARGGLIALGANYVLVGILAVQIGLGSGGEDADRTGALHAVAERPGGTLVLWLIAGGFAGLTLWRLAEAIYGEAGPDGHKPTKRLGSLARAVFYGFGCVSVVGFLLGSGGQSGNSQSKDVTGEFMSHSGGRWLVLAVGLGVAVAGIVIAVGGLRRKFLKRLSLDGVGAHARKVVETLGVVGVAARGVVFAVFGAFLVVAAVTFDAKKAEGLDGALRKTAATPLGPWLLLAVAVGLVAFGLYSWCESRWRDVQPGD